MKKCKLLLLPLFLLLLVSSGAPGAHAQIIGQQIGSEKEEVVTAVVMEVVEEVETLAEGRSYVSQRLKMKGSSGSVRDREFEVQSANMAHYDGNTFEVGDELLIGYQISGADSDFFYIISHSRTRPLLLLIAIFIGASILVARRHGLRSLAAMGLSFATLIYLVLPLISQGVNPILVSLLAVAVMIPIIFYVSHGVSSKVTTAVVATIITLSITSVLAKLFVDSTHLTGIVYDEIETLLYVKSGQISLKGLMVAGIVIGVLGILDDVTISQASVVEELRKAAPHLSGWALYRKAMNVGRDHIGSIINTLILVYVGSSLSTILLFMEYPRPALVLFNNEIVAMQIVVSLVGSISLIMAVPVTTLIASWRFRK